MNNNSNLEVNTDEINDIVSNISKSKIFVQNTKKHLPNAFKPLDSTTLFNDGANTLGNQASKIEANMANLERILKINNSNLENVENYLVNKANEITNIPKEEFE